ncbi:MAG TPA: heme-binding protein [Tepidisphaeraceae bacterium]|nr:heme-binding protein [Tepidisphaeraceae bacterium]
MIEPLEKRELLSAAPADLPDNQHLTKSDVQRILAAAASQALPTQIISVVDLDGQILGVVAMSKAKTKGAPLDQFGQTDPLISTLVKSISRARTGAFFESHQDAFTTRTARFIIQDNFPQGVPNTGGGPLYGVQFSSLPGSDIYSGPAISGDPGGIPLFKNGVPVGGIGVAGDGSDRLTRSDLPYDPKTLPNPSKPITASVNLYDGTEEHDQDEQVALAGAGGFMAPKLIQATNIFVGGLRFPFTVDVAASGKPQQTLDQIIASGESRLVQATKSNALIALTTLPYSAQTSVQPRSSPGSSFFPTTTMGGITGTLKNMDNQTAGANQFGFVSGATTEGQHLSVKNVKQVINEAVAQALETRADIRQPIGVPMRVYVTVVDTQGNLLGAFQMQDATNFSFDVAVQKARTAAFFSDDTHAFSTRTMGFISQQFFPAGINKGSQGPLYHIQNTLSLGGNFGIANRSAMTPKGNEVNPLRNGITIFPGGAPLYKSGILVGAIGISGDGVDQDDIIAFDGAKKFQSSKAIRSDALPPTKIVNFLTAKVTALENLFNLNDNIATETLDKLAQGLHGVQLPFQKFPRNPEL